MAGYSSAAKLSAYRSVAVQGATTDAEPHQLTSLLFKGALERLALAKQYISLGNKIEKTQVLHRVVEIINELRMSLDHAVGGELSANLESLYEYMVRRVLHANLKSDVVAIDEVISLLGEISAAWDAIPVSARSVQR